MGLNLTSNLLTTPIKTLWGQAFNIGVWALTIAPDFMYNWIGFFEGIKEEDTSDTQALNKEITFFKRHNYILRLPVLATGVGMVGKHGIDLFNQISNNIPMDPNSPYYLECGLGLISLASSMYIKESDPKHLDKEPFWKKHIIGQKKKLFL